MRNSRCRILACPATLEHARPLRRGITLLEVIMLLVIVAIVSVGVGMATQALAKAPAAADQEQAISMQLVSELETYRTMPFATLSTQSNINNTVSLKINGGTRSFTHVVTFQAMDPNSPSTNASPQSDFYQVRVTIGDRTAFLWVTKPS